MKKIIAMAVMVAAGVIFAGGKLQDFDAAKKISSEKNLPILLDFTGSDWCYWCKLMDEKVFSQKEWNEWCEKNMVLVTLDFPSDASSQPKKIRNQNEKLMLKYGVRGFPTFVILSKGGEKEIGRTQCPGRDVTPAVFIENVKRELKKAEASDK